MWYYEHPLPDGRKNYTKTLPIQYEEFEPCLKWFRKRGESDQAWKVSATELLANNCNPDRKNPRSMADFEHKSPELLAEEILKKEQRVGELIIEIMDLLKANA